MTEPKARIAIGAEDRASPVIRKLVGEMRAMSTQAFSVRNAFAPLSGALAGAFTVGALNAWVNRTIEGVDALNDLKDATGDSIENLSALEDIAVRTGTGMDVATSAVIKLNKELIAASRDPDSAPARAIRNLGLNIKELMALSPVERLQAVGRALNGFGGENKLEYNITLLGRSAAETAALLKNLGEAGALQAKVTTQQAEEAEKLRRDWFQLSKDATDLSRALAGPLVSSINDTIAKFREGSKEGKGFFRVLYDEQMKLLGLGAGAVPGLDGLRKELAGLEGALANVQLPPQMRIEYQERRLKLVQQIAAAEKEATASFLKNDKDTTPVDLPGLPALGNKPDEAALKRAAEERRKLAEFAARQIVDIEEQAAKDAAEAWGYWELSQQAAAKKRADALKLQRQQVFDEIDAEQERAIEEGQAYLNAIGATGKSVAAEIGLVFSSAAGEAITQWQGVDKLLKGILLDLAQIALKKTVTDPLGKAVGEVIDGLDLGGVVKGIVGGLFGGARATGGDVVAGRFYRVNERDGPGELLDVGGRQYLMARQNGRVQPQGVQASAPAAPTIVFNVGAGATVDDWRRSARGIAADLRRRMNQAGGIA